MTDGNTQAIAKYLDEREEWDALQEVTVELEQAESDNILLIARIEELEAELEYWREEADLGWDKAEERRAELAKAVGFIKNFALRAMIEEHDEDERDMIDFDSLRFERDCDIVQARTTLAELKGETDE
jgi:septal ring factor EnvC (AmiA/AmiB activator)